MTRTLARQMSRPVPSPSMNGMMGFSGTMSLPSRMVILAPCGGGVTFMGAAVDIDDFSENSSSGYAPPGPEMLAQRRRCAAGFGFVSGMAAIRAPRLRRAASPHGGGEEGRGARGRGAAPVARR